MNELVTAQLYMERIFLFVIRLATLSKKILLAFHIAERAKIRTANAAPFKTIIMAKALSFPSPSFKPPNSSMAMSSAFHPFASIQEMFGTFSGDVPFHFSLEFFRRDKPGIFDWAGVFPVFHSFFPKLRLS